MTSIGDRIRTERKALNKSQKEFAQALGLSENFIWMIEKGDRVPSDRTIADICRKFGVSEMWLRTGEGKPYPERGRLEELSYMAGRFLSSEPTEFQQRFAMMMYSLTDEEWKLLEQKARALLEELPEP